MLDLAAKETIQTAIQACEGAYDVVQSLPADSYTEAAMERLSECIGVLEFIAK